MIMGDYATPFIKVETEIITKVMSTIRTESNLAIATVFWIIIYSIGTRR